MFCSDLLQKHAGKQGEMAKFLKGSWANMPSFLLKTLTLSTETILSSNSFHKSTTLAQKNFCPIGPFLFLNNLYLCPRVPLLDANSKYLSHCIDSFLVMIL